jgi:hypothetical protein
MSTPILGRNARLLKGGVAIGYGRNISVKASAELIKEYSMDSLTPAVSGAGKQSFTWSMERLFTDETYIVLLIAGTQLIDYISKVTKALGEICALIEAGFEYVTEMDGLKFFKKRKT